MTVKVTYRPVSGSTLTQEQAERYGARIYALSEKYGDNLDDEHLIEDARNESSPLHDWFEWDDKVAAHKHRIRQASYLSRNIKIKVRTRKQDYETRAFYRVKTRNTRSGTYKGRKRQIVPAQRVLTKQEYREQIITEALKYLRAWRRKYAVYTELSELFDAVDSFEL